MRKHNSQKKTHFRKNPSMWAVGSHYVSALDIFILTGDLSNPDK